MSRRRFRFLLVLSTVLTPAAWSGELEYRWSNQVQVAAYGNSGNEAASPFASTGLQSFDDFQFDFTYQSSRYSRWAGQFSGAADDSDYRSQGSGFAPNVIAIDFENGAARLPYRVRLGNQYADFSHRTLRHAIKGALLELQPQSEGQARHSLMFTAGVTDSSWRDTVDDPGEVAGAAWLFDSPVLGRLALNYVHYSDPGVLSGEFVQQTTSIAFERLLSIGEQDIDIEAEVARFSGDHRDLDGPGSGRDRSATGYTLSLDGNNGSALTWRARFEEYGLDFQPELATVAANRRSQELHAGWAFHSGLRWRGRLQHYETGFEEPNPEETLVYGVSFNGPLAATWDPLLSGSVDAFVEERDNANATLDARTTSLRLNVSRQLSEAWSGQFGAVFLDDEDKVKGTGRETAQFNVDLNRRVAVLGMRGSLAAGVQLRDVSGGIDSREFRPRLGLSLSEGAHALRMNLGTLVQNRAGPGALDTRLSNLSLGYTYQRHQHRFGLNAELGRRDPDNAASTESWRVAATWRYAFDGRPERSFVAPTGSGSEAGALRRDAGLLVRLPLGVPVAEAAALLTHSGLPQPVTSGFGRVFEVSLIPGVTARQRLGVLDDEGIANSVAIVIDLDPDSAIAAAEIYSQTADALLRQFGAPASSVETGRFDGDLASAVRSGELVRHMVWRVAGRSIGLSLVSHLSGGVRLEVQAVPGGERPPVLDFVP
jgi:hypothetical protein